MTHVHNDRGFALAGAVFALVIVGALVTAGFFAASQESRIGYSMQYSADAFFAAERGLSSLVGSKPMSFYDDSVDVDSIVKPGGYQAISVTTDGVASEYSVTVRGLGDRLYYVESTGRVTGGGRFGGASRRTAMVVRTFDFEIEPDGALKTFGGLDIRGSGRVDGADDDPSGWAGCALGADKAGVVAKDSSSVDFKGKTSPIAGNPPVDEEPGMTADDFFDFGGMDYDRLASLADPAYVFPDGANPKPAPAYTGGGFCDTGSGTNWGAPEDQSDVCAGHFPLMHAEGDLRLSSNGSGQGILLVDGDLHISGGFEFYGIVIVKGKLTTGSGTSGVHGATMVYTGGDATDESVWSGTPIITYSSCAVTRAIEFNAATNRAFPIGDRSWIDLTATGALAY